MSNHYVQKAYTFLKKSGVTISGVWIDCGCGRGYYSRALTLLGAALVIGIDVRMRSLNYPIVACRSDCSHLPVKNCSVSGFLYVNVLHYYKKPQPLLQEAHRVLKKNGYIVIIEYDQSAPTGWDPYPLQLTHIEALLSRVHFDVVTNVLVDKKYRPKNVVVGKKLIFNDL